MLFFFVSNSVAVKSKSYFGAGRGQIWIDDLRCNGNETSLDGCASRPWGQNNCDHSEDLSVICRSKFRSFVYFDVFSGSISL